MTDSDSANQPLTPPPPPPSPPPPSPPSPPPPPPPPYIAPPSGYSTPGGYQHQNSPQFRRVGSIGRAISILMLIMIAVQLLVLALSPAAHDAARDYLAQVSSDREFRDALGPTAAVSVLSGLLIIAIAVLTMIWMFRMAKNLQIVQRVATWTPGWAIGGWFLPPSVLYVIPYLMLRDLWRGSAEEPNTHWRANAISPLVHAWFVFYGLLPIAFITITLSGTSLRGDNLRKVASNLDDQFARSIVAGLVQIAAAGVYFALVRKLTQRHTRFIHETP